ncbi:MAG: glycosyltransferase, partial [Bacteroidales bacterium]|nr:glycosyltransferase [Bacteroidales bacterium]
MDLSIVIPVYNEEQKIRHDILAASNFLSGYGMTGEIIVVDDGSSDQTSEVASNTIEDEGVSLKIIAYKEHTGKGKAVKTGIMEAGSDLIMFIDSGNCVPYENISRGIDLFKDGECEIAHGSRFLTESIITRPRKQYRKLVSFLFRKYMRILSRLPKNLTDTQCGLKIYRKEIAYELYAACISDGFLFDVEIILRAREKGYRIMEFPIEWTTDPDSRLSVSR